MSTDTLGLDTEIKAPASTFIEIVLENMDEVIIKRVSVPGGSLTVTGSGALGVENPDVVELSRIYGVRISGGLKIKNGATLTAIGVNGGVAALGSTGSNIEVMDGATLYGTATGLNTSVLKRGKIWRVCIWRDYRIEWQNSRNRLTKVAQYIWRAWLQRHHRIRWRTHWFQQYRRLCEGDYYRKRRWFG